MILSINIGLYNLFKKILFVIDQCNKNIYKSWDSWRWNNWQVHIFKIYNNKKNLINNIYYLTKCQLHNILFWKKKFNDRNGQKHDPIQEIPKIYAKQFIRGFNFKEYEDNNRDKMHWMRSYETCLLIILNYTYHLEEKIIIHHIIYIKK